MTEPKIFFLIICNVISETLKITFIKKYNFGLFFSELLRSVCW